MNRRWYLGLVLVVVAWLGACSGSESDTTGGGQGATGAPGGGGTTTTSSTGGSTTGSSTGGNGGSGAGAACPAGTIQCQDNTMQVCDGEGGYSDETDCAGLGQICLPGQGCRVCAPNTGSCADGVGTYCLPDGSGYATEICDPLQGLTCADSTGRCTGPCSQTSLGRSYIGCDYYPTVTANTVHEAFHFAVAVSNTTGLDATVTVTRGVDTVASVAVAPNSVQVIQLPWVLELKGPAWTYTVPPMPGSVRVDDGAYRLRSTQPVTVYQFNPLEYRLADEFSVTNDASLLLPVNAWTGTYYAVARHHFWGASGFYAVTAKDDNTTVTVTPGPYSGIVKAGVAGVGADGNGQVVLNAGDVIELVTDGTETANDPNDVTGTKILADKPVQVIGGHLCIYIPEGYPACDHLEESMFPYETLDTEYLVTAPLIPTGGNTPKIEMVRILATAPNTTLSYDPPQTGAPGSIALAGEWVELANNAADFQITASAPVIVMQYMEGQEAGGGLGDPAMALAVTKAQYRDSYLFHSPTNYESSYVNIVAPTGTVVTLDGAAIDLASFVAIGATGYSVSRQTVSNLGDGNHTITGAQPFGISVYGYGQYTSYWYPGGSNLTVLH